MTMTTNALNRDQLLDLLKAAKFHSTRAHCMVLLGFKHAMRCSEITGLRLEDINIKESWIRVRRLKGSMTSVQPLEKHPGRSLLDEVSVLRAWLRVRKEDGTPFLFTSSHGGQLNRSSFYRLFRQVAQAAGLPKELQHPHSLKHACGALLAASNANVFVIQRHLGHRALSSAAVYTQGMEDRQVSREVHSIFMQVF